MNSRQGALQYELILRQRVLDGGSTSMSRPTPVTLKDLSERWLRDHVARHNRRVAVRTRRSHLRAHILPALGRLNVDQFSTLIVDDFARRLTDDGLAPKTVNNVLGTLRSCLLKGKDWDLVARVPKFTAMKLPPPSKAFLSIEEAGLLLSAAPPGLWRTMMLVALTTGLRVGELLALEWDDINGDLVTVARTEVHLDVTPPKSGALRGVPLVEETLAALSVLPRSSKRVFPMPSHLRSPYNHAWRALSQISRRAGVPAHWHLFRHTFASQLILSGAPLTTAQACLGHATVQMTWRYVYLDPKYLRSELRCLPRFDNSGHSVGTAVEQEAQRLVKDADAKSDSVAQPTQNRVLAGAA